MTASQAFQIVPPLVIAPPLTGCSTLADLHHDYATAIDYERNNMLSLRGASLKQRRAELCRHVDMHQGFDFVCVPCLPRSEMLDSVFAVVLIPASDFVRRIMTVPMGQGGDGLRVAATIWRDEACALAARYNLAVVESLDLVSVMSCLQNVTGTRRPITQRMIRHGITTSITRPER
jgi:hypothetical protein